MVKKNASANSADKTRTAIKGLSFVGVSIGAQPMAIDIHDDKIVRIRPLHYDWKYRPEELGIWKIEARGKTFEVTTKHLASPLSLCYKKRIYSPNRITYPLKRVDFHPKGDRNTSNRGKSEYIRISWNEALDIIVGEIKRIIATYGPYAILAQIDGHGETKTIHCAHGSQWKLLDLLGGYTLQARNPDSWEGWYWGAKHVWGMEPVGMQIQSNVVVDVAQNTDILLHWGCDAETTPWAFCGQLASRVAYWFTELGIKQVFVSPDLNYSGAVHADKWIPVLPNTDAALQLAIAYVWITEGTYDKWYIETHTVGFKQFKDYVLGQEDGIPKTPEWASAKCSVPEWTIKALAREMAAKKTSIAHCCGGSYIRGPYSHEPARLECILLGMQGLGKPGIHQMRFTDWGFAGNPDEVAVPRTVSMPVPMAAHSGRNEFAPELSPKQMIPKPKLPDAILNPPVSWYGGQMLFIGREYQFKKYDYPAEGCPEIHMIWSDTPSWMTCWNHGFRMVEAYRSPKLEFILGQHQWMENDLTYADIILPVSTKFEQEDIGGDQTGGQFVGMLYEKKCIEPLGESKSDYEIACLIADRLGLLQEFTGGMSVKEKIQFGFEHSGVEEYISFDEFKEKGYWTAPLDPDWDNNSRGLSNFYRDPKSFPLKTPSGKLEFYSQTLADCFPGDEERPPCPRWIPYGESHRESLECERARKYPLLVVSNHPRWAVHSEHQDVTWFREIPTCKIKGSDSYQYHPVWIHPVDAKARNINHGDVIEVFNERGGVLGGAYVTERIMPGVMSIDHGAKCDQISQGKLDRGGAINLISPYNSTSKNTTGMATSGYLADVARVDLDQLKAQYPEAFRKPFHPTAGPGIESYLCQG